MADKKISALTAATTPLAGTEVLPIVQSGSTVKVAVSDLTAGRAASAASLAVTGSSAPANGVYLPAANAVGIAASGAEQVRVTSGALQMRSGTALYVYNATNDGLGLWYNPGGAGVNQLVARVNGADRETIDGATGNITNHTGNWVQGTAAKGINFTANTPAAGMTSQLLNWYEEGTWTPTVTFGGGNTGITGTFAGRYTRIGRQVIGYCTLAFSNKGSSTGAMSVSGLPFTSGSVATFACPAGYVANLASAFQLQAWINETATDITMQKGNLASTANVTDADIQNNTRIDLSFTYLV